MTAFPSVATILPPETASSPGTAFMPSAILGHEERKSSWDSAGIWGTAIVRYGILSELVGLDLMCEKWYLWFGIGIGIGIEVYLMAVRSLRKNI